MNRLIPPDPIESDAGQNLRMAYHLYKSGVLSNQYEVEGTPAPTNYREPFPPFVSAVFMAIHPGIDQNTTLRNLQSGENTRHIKQVNLLWILLLMSGTGLLTYVFTKNRFLPFLVLFLVLGYFIRFGNHFASLFTELPAATLIVWSTLLLLLAVKRETIPLYIAAGFSLGLLVLTKAVFYYLFILVLFFLILFASSRKKLVKVSLFAIGTFIVVGPYLIRNYSIYEEIGITQRGGIVLHLRATENAMTGDEIKGAIYLWGPALYKAVVQNTVLGANENDFESGGKYVRINRNLESDSVAVNLGRPDLAESFFHRSRAEMARLQRELGSDEEQAPRRIVFDRMQADAEEMILSDPFKHVAMSALFYWRGMWCFPNPTLPLIGEPLQSYLHNFVNLLAYISLFGLFILGLFKLDKSTLAFTILPVSMLLFHGFATHNNPRFSEPAIPSMLICFAAGLYFLTKQKFAIRLFHKLNLLNVKQ